MSWLKRSILITFILITFSSNQAAYAHVDISATSPADGAVLATAPKESVLTFQGIVDPASVTEKLTDINGKKLENPKVLGDGGPSTVVKFSLPELPNNTYIITYRENSSDGHTIEGEITFTVGPAPINAPTGKIFHQKLFGRNLEILSRFTFDIGGSLLVGSLFWLGILLPRKINNEKPREVRKNIYLNFTTRDSKERDNFIKRLITASTFFMTWGAMMRVSSYLVQYLPGSSVEDKYRLVGSRSLWAIIISIIISLTISNFFKNEKFGELVKIYISSGLLFIALYLLALVSHAADQSKPFLDALIWATHVSMAYIWLGPVLVAGILWFMPRGSYIEKDEFLYGFSEFASVGFFAVIFAIITGLAQAFVYSGNTLPSGDYRNILIGKIILILCAGGYGLWHNRSIKKGKILKGGSLKWEIAILVTIVAFAALLAITSPLSN